MKKFICILLTLTLILSAAGVFASSEAGVELNGAALNLTRELIEKDGVIFVPLRDICSALGYEIAWDNDKRCAVVTSDSFKAEFFIGKAEYRRGGMTTTTDAAAFIENEITYVSASSLAAIGAEAEWDGEKKLLSVTVDLLADKYFRIIQTSSGKALSLEGGNLGDGVRLVMEEVSDSDMQLWRLSPGANGSYQPLNKKSGRSFDIPNARHDIGLNLIQYGITMGDNQFIVPIENGDGTYSIRFRHADDLFLTVAEDNHTYQDEFIGGETQTFTLEEVKISAPVRSEGEAYTQEGGEMGGRYFSILLAETGEAVTIDRASLEKGARLALKAPSADDFDVWLFTTQGSGYTITNRGSSLSMHEGDELIQYTTTYKPAQVFTLKENEDGSFIIQNEKSSLCLTAADGFVTLAPEDGSSSQRFMLATPLYDASIYGHDTLAGKYFTITNVFAKKCLCVEDASLNNSARILLGEQSDDASLQWSFIAQGSSMYTVVNKNSNLALDIPAGSTAPGAPLTQYTPNFGNNQIFEFIEQSDGSYLIKNKNSGLYLTLKNGYISQEKRRNASLQSFILTETGESGEKMIGAAATLFLLKGKDTVSNAKLQWNSVSGADRYDIYRSVDGGDFTFFSSLSGTSLDDYDLELGRTYSYRVYALEGSSLIDFAQTEEVEPYPLPSNLKSSSNLEESSLDRPNSLCVDGVYYNFSSWGREDGNGFGRLMMRTSTDDITYGEWTEVLNYEEILANETCSDFSSCRFESQNFVYNPVTNEFVFIAHFEADGGYGTAMTSFASGKPGERFTFHRAIRPEGGDTRDLNVYIDDDNKAYLIAAINVNADLALYELDENWTNVKRLVCIVNKSSWRELPSMLKVDGRYYLFTSGTAGWYPTQGMYNTADSIDGPWSPLRHVGNTSTFSSQSGTVFKLKEGSKNYIMSTYRWMYFWSDAIAKRTTNRRYPVKVSDGYAFYDFFDELLYNWDDDVLVPVQNGRLLSQNMPSVSSPAEGDVSLVNDGDYRTYWYGGGSDVWPFTWEVDLGKVHSLSELQISWLIWNGSEPYYKYKLEGSIDGKTYTTLLDKTEGYSDYGFTADPISGSARYVRLTVVDAKPRSSNENHYPAQLYEVKVFGS